MSESTNRINVGREMDALLRKLGLEPSFVKEFHSTPRTVTATLFKRDKKGAKYTEPVSEYLPGGDGDDVSSFSYQPATETVEFEIRT